MNSTDSDVLLVGSLPFENAEETFRAAAHSLNDHIGWIPDGEFGIRKIWTPMLPEYVYSQQADLEDTLAPPAATSSRRRSWMGRRLPIWTGSGTSASSRGTNSTSKTCAMGSSRSSPMRV